MKNLKVKSLSIIFPLYNEESRLKNSLKKINFLISKIKHINYEILLINDGSRDNSDSLITNYLKNIFLKVSLVDCLNTQTQKLMFFPRKS